MIKSLLQCIRRGLAVFGVYRRRRAARQRRGACRLTILMYHRIGCASPGNSRLSVSTARFEDHLRFLQSHYDILDMDTAVELLRAGRSPQRNSVAITFDDGYADNVQNALPLLMKHEVPALVYVVPGYVGTDKLFWWDRLGLVAEATIAADGESLSNRSWYLGAVREIIERCGRDVGIAESVHALGDKFQTLEPAKRDLILDEWEHSVAAHMDSAATSRHVTADWNALRQLAESRVDVGCHTVTHACLTMLPPQAAKQEIEEARVLIETQVGLPVRHFAYPYGQAGYVSSVLPHMVQEAGFQSACLAIPGACQGSGLFTLPRVYAGDFDTRDLEIQIERIRSPIVPPVPPARPMESIHA
ncbi:MAG: polysaccharide deacetylase family protein [Verrucomicrobia bacterium]|nr:polysaccharide deacetylase family protein [Verrucomicrobiota bacterium]MDA1086077.1 polysaccharide deacetylase family protein [Verrucomicrobiota bacterium]